MRVGVVAPQLLAGIGIQRNHVVAGRADKNLVTHLQGRGLVLGTGAGGFGHIAGLESPGHLQLLDVVHIDLVQRRKAVVVAAVAVVAPVLLRAGGIHRLAADGGLVLHLGVDLEHGSKTGQASQQQHPGQRQRALVAAGVARCAALQQRQAGADHGCAKGHRQQARDQAPVVQPHLGQGPQHRGRKRSQVQPAARAATAQHLHARQQQAQARQQKVPAAAQADELAAADQEGQAGNGQHCAQYPEQQSHGQ